MISGTKIRPGTTKTGGSTMKTKVDLYFYALCTLIPGINQWEKDVAPDVKHIYEPQSFKELERLRCSQVIGCLET